METMSFFVFVKNNYIYLLFLLSTNVGMAIGMLERIMWIACWKINNYEIFKFEQSKNLCNFSMLNNIQVVEI